MHSHSRGLGAIAGAARISGVHTMAGEYTNGTGRCPTGAVNARAIGELERRMDGLEDTVKEATHATQSAFAQFSAKLDAVLTDRETQRAKLSISGTIAVAVVAALATVLAQLLPQLVK